MSLAQNQAEGSAAQGGSPGLPIVIELAAPVSQGEEQIDRLVFSRPLKVRDLKGVKVASLAFDDFALVIGRLTGWPASVIEQMEMPDFTRAMEVVTSFLEGGQTTGSRA